MNDSARIYNLYLYFLIKQKLLNSGEKMLMSADFKGKSRDLYKFLIFFRQGVIMPSFIIVEYVWQILDRF